MVLYVHFMPFAISSKSNANFNALQVGRSLDRGCPRLRIRPEDIRNQSK